MNQLSLFASQPHGEVLVDDATGRIVHIADAVDVATAARWFDELHARIAWHADRRLMYDREVDVPRLLAHRSLSDPELPGSLRDALALVRRHEDAPFNSIGLNLYRDGNDSVAPHNDKVAQLVPHMPIVLLSLGATRQMVIRGKQAPHRRIVLDLHAGDMLTMDWTTQFHYDHGIPKTRTTVGPRISAAFRVRPSDGTWGNGQR
jgi:alkylated DNA repair dioxygenase AlkB